MRNSFLKKSAIAVVLAAGFAVYSLNSRLHTADEKTKAGAHLDSEQKTSHIGTPSPAKASNSLAAPISANAENATGTGVGDILKARVIGSFDDAPLGPVSTGPWAPVQDAGSSADFTIVEGGVNGTGRALQVAVHSVSNRNLWDLQLVRENNSVVPQVIYNYSAWIKGTKGAEVSFAVESPEYLNLDNKAKILTGDWQLVAFQFVTEGDEVRTPIHFSSPHNPGSTILVDEITLGVAQ